jgi:ATP-dependent RNA helicase DDX5/DBP2
VVDEYDKSRRLLATLRQVYREGVRTLIFTETKRNADNLTRSLRQEGFAARAIHGDKPQDERDWVLREFKAGTCCMMVATDVAARGLGVHGSVFGAGTFRIQLVPLRLFRCQRSYICH